MADIDDTLISKLVLSEHDALRDVTGEPENQVPTYSPIAYAANGQID
jgi:hypothetical protein